MSDSPTPPFPTWMVRNGTTWTIVDFSDRVEGYREVRHIKFSHWGEDRPAKDALLVLALRDFRVVGPSSSGGWASIACGSESTGWLNLVIEDGHGLAQVLEQADRRSVDYPTIDEIMAARPFVGPDAETFGELFSRLVMNRSSDSVCDPIAALDAVTNLWELVFQKFQLGGGEAPKQLSMLMYADKLHTMTLLENGRYLPRDQETEMIGRDDLRTASCLRRLRTMTTWASRGLDIDKRCREAIEAHVKLRPQLGHFYGSALSV